MMSLPYSPTLQTPVCDVPLPVSMCSCCSTPTHEWELAVFGFLFLCQFAENDGFQLHPCPCKGHELILFYGCIVFHVYIPQFIHSLIDGHLRWFHNFAIVNCAAINVCKYLFPIMTFLLGRYPVVELLDQMVFLVLDHWGITTLSSIMVELIYTPTNSVKVFPFLHILSGICCLLIF